MKIMTLHIAVGLILTSFSFSAFGQNLSPDQLKALDQQAYEEGKMRIKSGQIEYRSVFSNPGGVTQVETEPVTTERGDSSSSEASSLKPADISLFRSNGSENHHPKEANLPSPGIVAEPKEDPKFDLPANGSAEEGSRMQRKVTEDQPAAETPKSVVNFRSTKGPGHQPGVNESKPE